MTLAPVLTNCHVCRDPRVELINSWMKAGVSDVEIARRLKEGGDGYSRITLGKHKRRHLMGEHERQRKAAADSLAKQAKTIKGPRKTNLLEMVREIGIDSLAAGEISVTLDQAIRADVELRKLAEKGADREMILVLAQVLGGATPVLAIEGEFREVDEEALEDGAMFAGLLGAG